MNNKKIKRLLFLFFLIDAILFGVYGYLYYVVDSKNKETAALYIVSHQAASEKEKIQGLIRTLKDTEKDRNKLSGYFVTKINAVTFIEQIEKIGKDAGIDLSVNSVSDGAKDSGTIQLSFSAAGNFPDMYRLIALIESMPYKATLKKVDVQAASDSKEGGKNWKGNFIVSLESFAPASAASPATDSDAPAKK